MHLLFFSTMSQVSSVDAMTSDDEVQISSGSESSKTKAEAQTDSF
jgi:hypothetical protein